MGASLRMARERQPLALAAGQAQAAVADLGGVAVALGEDELVRRGSARGRHDLFRARAEAPERNVRSDRVVEQGHLLADDRDGAAQRGERDLAQVLAVDEDAAGRDVEEPRHEVDDGRLARSRAADERHRLAARDLEIEVRDRRRAAVFRIGEGDVLEADGAGGDGERARAGAVDDARLLVEEGIDALRRRALLHLARQVAERADRLPSAARSRTP